MFVKNLMLIHQNWALKIDRGKFLCKDIFGGHFRRHFRRNSAHGSAIFTNMKFYDSN